MSSLRAVYRNRRPGWGVWVRKPLVLSALLLFLAVARGAHADASKPERQGRACVIRPQKTEKAKLNPPPSPKGPFTDVTKEAGVYYLHGPHNVPPNCLLTDYTYKPTKCDNDACRQLHQRSVTVNVDETAPDHSGIELPGTLCEAEYGLGAATTGDIDGDGLPDIFASRLDKPPVLFRNKGDGTFVDITVESGLGNLTVATSGAALADLDSDGDVDIYVTTIGGSRWYLFLNDGAGSFTEVALERGTAASSPHAHVGSSVAVGDYDNDGFLDIHTTEWAQEGHSPLDRMDDRYPWFASRLYRNLGKQAPGYFEDVTEKANLTVTPILTHFTLWQKQGLNGTFNLASAFVDLDDDGWLDLVVNGDFGTSRLYWNNKGIFRNGFEHIERDMNAMGLTFADVDHDGDLDYYVTQIWDPYKKCYKEVKVEEWCGIGWVGSVLYINEGNRHFVDATERPEYNMIRKTDWAWGAAFLDYDNDGDDDLAVVSGFTLPGTTAEDEYNLTPNRLFENVDGTYKETYPDMWKYETRQGRALFTFDYDNDGDLDIFVVNNADQPQLWRNDADKQGHFLRVRAFNRPMAHTAFDEGFHGHSPSLNCKVYVKADKDSKWKLQHTGVGSHFMGTSEQTSHFGLGDTQAETLHRVLIHWPATNVTLSLRQVVPIDTVLEVTQPAGRNLVYVVTRELPECAAKESQFESDTEDSTNEGHSYAPLEIIEKRKQNDDIVHRLEDPYNPPYSPSPDEADLGLDHLVQGTFSPETTRSITGQPIRNTDQTICGLPGRNLRRLVPSAYADGKSEPAGPSRPSARVVSNAVARQNGNIYDKLGLNDMFVAYGQFLSHDMDLTTPMYRPTRANSFPIMVPKGDTFFDIKNTGVEVLRFKRSMYDARTSPREQFNKVTAFIDGSQVYGSGSDKADSLRTLSSGVSGRGELRTNAKYPHFLPFNTGSFENDNPMGRKVDQLGIAGDPRSNATPGLTVLHIVWLREHNRIAKAIVRRHPSLPDDQVYHRARQIVIALMQHITYTEYLPALLGPKYATLIDPRKYSYNASACLDTSNLFTTAAFRFGHSQVSPIVQRLGEDWKVHFFGHVSLRDAYFHPGRIHTEGGVDPLIRGMYMQKAQDIDVYAVDDVRNFLFGSSKLDGGLDLTAANIQRGRDHGLPDYRTVRTVLGLGTVKSFNEISTDPEILKRLSTAYAHKIEDVDVYIGGLAEDHVAGGAVGPTFAHILSEQFVRTRDNDPLFYTREGLFTKEELKDIESTTLSDVIRRNSGVKDLPDDAFHAPKSGSNTADADAKIDL